MSSCCFPHLETTTCSSSCAPLPRLALEASASPRLQEVQWRAQTFCSPTNLLTLAIIGVQPDSFVFEPLPQLFPPSLSSRSTRCSVFESDSLV